MKKLSLKLIGVLIIGIMILQSTVVIAASSINDLKSEQQNNSNKINNVEKEKEEIQQQKSETVKEVEEITSQISEYESQINELDQKISNLNSKIKESEEKLNKAQEDYTKQEELLNARLVATYEAGETSYLDVLLSSESITDLISNYYLVTEVATNDTELMEKIQKEKEEIEKAKTELEINKKELDTSKADKQGVTTKLQASKSEKNAQVAKLSEDEKKLQQQIDELNKANQSIDGKIKAAQEAIRKAQEAQNKNNANSNNGNSNSGGSGGTTSSSSSGFIYPVPSAYAKITTGLYYSSGQYHGAVDFGCGGINGQPVYAVADGYVVTSERLNGSYGNYILIAHYNGLYTLYAHGQDGSRTVSAGQTVKKGQQIMRVGSTGNSSGPHLHFEVRKSPGTYSNRVNPQIYL
ncbi:MAG: peptidoglycan DD-metalloendopeptidase family protein [Clostridia bacterium]|nr:peptidoglycan DD-metalloendopeptidase family protein [Clostridia bacterium]